MDEKTFTDEQVTAACGLHLDNLRRLITWGAVKPIQAGGGRGRVRLWTFVQAMRIAVTAEFVDAGLSLQMAHTLTYCLPLDDMLHLYNPSFIEQHVDLTDPKEAHIKALISAEADDYWPREGMVGEIIILERRMVYADALGDVPSLFGLIDLQANLYYPTYDPKQFLWGLLANEIEGLPKSPAIANVNRTSLLIPDLYFSSTSKEIGRFCRKITRNLDTQLDDPDDYHCRNYMKINLNVGLAVAFRKLLGLPVSYLNLQEQLNG